MTMAKMMTMTMTELKMRGCWQSGVNILSARAIQPVFPRSFSAQMFLGVLVLVVRWVVLVTP
jgi:hypothetical protein